MLVIVGMSTEEHFLRSQVGIGSESDCLLGQPECRKKQEVLMEEKVYVETQQEKCWLERSEV